jgi:hypothetical protein
MTGGTYACAHEASRLRANPFSAQKELSPQRDSVPHASPALGRTTSAAGFLAHGSDGFDSLPKALPLQWLEM